MLFLAFLFVGFIILVAFYLDSFLDKREARRAADAARKRRAPM